MHGGKHSFKKFRVRLLPTQINHKIRLDIDKVECIPGKVYADNHRIGIGNRPDQRKALLKLRPFRRFLGQLFLRNIMKGCDQNRISVRILHLLHYD